MNVLRATLMARVAVPGAEFVTFFQYDGVIREPEVIAHRIGQLPFRFKADFPTAPRDVPPDARFGFTVAVTAPEDKPLTWVTSKDFKPASDNTAVEIVHYTSDAAAGRAFADDGFMVCPLHAGERLHAVVLVRVADGGTDTRWTSVHPVVTPLGNEHGSEGFQLSLTTTGAVTARHALLQALKFIVAQFRAVQRAG